jgi:hypothetical protein
MTKLQELNLDKLEIIDEQDVQAKVRKATPYRELLKRIHKGKAMVITENDANVRTIAAGVRRIQKRGEFKRYRLAERHREDGVHILYIINPSDEETEMKYRRVPPEERRQRMEQGERTS